MLQSLLFQRPWRPPGNQQLQTWQNKSMNRMDASLFDYKNRDQVHFSVTTKAFSLCQKLPYILSNLRDIYTSSTIHCQLQRRINVTFTRHWTNFARFRKFVRLGFPFTRNNLNRTKIYTLSSSNGFGKSSLFVLSANGWKDQNMASSFSRPRKP